MPGIMLASAALKYANRYGVAVGKNVAVFTNNDDGYTKANQLKNLGVNVKYLIDVRSQIDPSLKVDDSINYISEHAVTSAYGSKSLSSIEIAKYDANTNSIGSSKKINVDALLVSGGYTPTINLCSQTGTPAVFDDPCKHSFQQGKSKLEGCGAVIRLFLEEILTTNKIEIMVKKPYRWQ